MTAQIRGVNQAIRNANDGVSVAQTAEGALAETGNILQRIRELAVQSANATNSAGDRQALQSEVNQLKTEMNRIASTTTFNGVSVLDGSYQNQSFQVGSQSGSDNTIGVSIRGGSSGDLGNHAGIAMNATVRNGTGAVSVPNITLAGARATFVVDEQTLTIGSSIGIANDISILDGASAQGVATAINAASGRTGVSASASTTATLSGLSADGTVSFILGTGTGSATINAAVTTGDLSNLASSVNEFSGSTGVTATSTNGTLTLTNGEGKDIDIDTFSHTTGSATIAVQGSAEGAGVNLVDAAANSAVFVGEVKFSSANAFSASSTIANTAGSVFNLGANAASSSSLSAVSSVDISSSTGAVNALDVLDQALAGVSSIRADLGAIQNRFQSTIANLSSISENVSSARSRIQDADFAAETANLTRNQIVQQAGIAMLAQANALPQNVLALLQ